jgi:hypothetical protein
MAGLLSMNVNTMRLFKKLTFVLLIVPVALIVWIFGLWEDPKSRWCRFYLWLVDGSDSTHFRNESDG